MKTSEMKFVYTAIVSYTGDTQSPFEVLQSSADFAYPYPSDDDDGLLQDHAFALIHNFLDDKQMLLDMVEENTLFSVLAAGTRDYYRTETLDGVEYDADTTPLWDHVCVLPPSQKEVFLARWHADNARGYASGIEGSNGVKTFLGYQFYKSSFLPGDGTPMDYRDWLLECRA